MAGRCSRVLGAARTRLAEAGQRGGPCTSDTAHLPSNHWWLLLITQVQTQRQGYCGSSTPSLPEVTSRGCKGPGLFFLLYFSLFPILGARHWKLRHSKAPAIQKKLESHCAWPRENADSRNNRQGISLVVQRLRTHLAMKGTLVQSLVRELRSHMPQGS